MHKQLSLLRTSISAFAASLKALQVLIDPSMISMLPKALETFNQYKRQYHEFHGLYETAVRMWNSERLQEQKDEQEVLDGTIRSCDIAGKSLDDYVNNFKMCSFRLGQPLLLEALREQRMIDIYQKWRQYLSQQTNEISQVYFLTYQKKIFFKKAFHQQTIVELIKSLRETISEPAYVDCDAKTLYQQIVVQKKKLLLAVEQEQSQLIENLTWMQRAMATCLLGITQQPMYQLGSLAAQAMSKSLEAYPHIPILSYQLPQGLQEKLNSAVGVTFLATSLFMSSGIGYSYQLIATLNSFLLAQQDALVRVGNYFEAIAQYTYLPVLDYLEQHSPLFLKPRFRWIKEIGRYDEQGLLEKETFIAWLSGLGIQLVLSGGQNLLPAGSAYILGTGCGELASRVVEKGATACRLKPETTAVLKVGAHVAAYSLAYQYGFQQVYDATAVSAIPQRFSQAEALKLFGLHAHVNEKILRDRYRELALENHPDKCESPCLISMADINEAYQVLSKKLK